VRLYADLEPGRSLVSHPSRKAGKRILRAALTEIVVRRDGAIIHAVLHWQGGDHTQLQVKQRLNAAGRHNPRIPDDTTALVRELARLMCPSTCRLAGGRAEVARVRPNRRE
jgi:hypothetical protein